MAQRLIAAGDTVLYRTSLADLDRQTWIRGARVALGDEAVATIWQVGASMTPDDAIAYALSDAGETSEQG